MQLRKISALTLALSLAPAIGRAEAAPTAGDFREDAWYLDVSPGLVKFSLLNSNPTLYNWGVGGGHRNVWPSGFTLTEGVTLEHAVGSTRGATLHLVRLGIDFRLGWSGRRIFVYAPIGASLDIVRGVRLERDIAVAMTAVGKGVQIGAGLLGKVTARISLGAEFDAGISAAREYFDVLCAARLLLQVGF